MEIMKIIGVAFITAICTVIIKATKPELTFAINTAGALVILLIIFSNIEKISPLFTTLTSITKIDNQFVKILLKMVAIGYLTEVSAGILNDFGSATLADKVVLGGKFAILILALPIFNALLDIIKTFLSVV